MYLMKMRIDINIIFCQQVRMCRRDREVWERVEAANTLAYLTEVSTELQRTAAMTDHLILTMNDYLKDTLVMVQMSFSLCVFHQL